MAKISAGLLMYRIRDGVLEVLLAHPGGPFWRNKDAGAWTIPKGEVGDGEALLDCARREFAEETGFEVAEPFVDLGSIRQKSGKTVHAWAFRGDCDPAELRSNTIEVEWPPKTGRRLEIPEVDRAEFFDLKAARVKINPAQIELLDRLEKLA
jgi:predicted NUDIX family NTP pyrophosphohydrolase